MYILFRDPVTGEETTLADMIRTGSDDSCSHREYDLLTHLTPEEEYMILMGSLREQRQDIILKQTLWRHYTSWMNNQGKPFLPQEAFDRKVVQQFPGVREVFIGEKSYWLGIRLRKEETA